ncbi:MAG TPA: Mpo1-like protein [Aequorivita sp.]|nr:Mpo1-like protein [Aequorivita sp.]
MSKKLQILLDEYGESHQNETNKLIHWICVPLIFWSIIALFYSIPTSFLVGIFDESFFSNWVVIVMIPVLIYYFYLSIPIALGMFFFIGSSLFISDFVLHNSSYPLWVIALCVFILAWIGQFYGHKVEGKKPSFLKDIQFLLIGPAWLMSFIFKGFRGK